MQESGWSFKWPARFAALSLATVLFVLVFHPAPFVLDAYDYMFVGFHPAAYGSHPFGFGILFRAVARVSQSLWDGAFAHLFQAWQLGSALVVVRALTRDRKWRLPPETIQRAATGALAFLTLVVVAPGSVYLLNGYFSEPTSFALLAMGILAFTWAHDRRGGSVAWAAFWAIALIGYHIRYQHIVLPLAALLTLAVRRLLGRITTPHCARDALVVAIVTASLPLSQPFLAQGFPVSEYGRAQPEVFLRKSIQCRLRCDARLFETSCDTPEGRHLIESSSCAHLVHVQEDALGKPYPALGGVSGTVFALPPKQLAKWLLLAPLDYLRQTQHPFEFISYTFDRHVFWYSEHVPEVIAHYDQVFSTVDDAPSPAFRWVLDYIDDAYRVGALHWFAVGAFWVSCAGLFFASRDVATAALFATTIATFMLFSYFQPQIPVRYLLHLTFPAVLGLWRTLLPRRE